VEDVILKTDVIIYIHTTVSKAVFILITFLSRDKWVPVTMAWSVLRLQMEEQPAVWRVVVNVLNKQ
jgi:Flp pilus assembly protein protease CpaA